MISYKAMKEELKRCRTYLKDKVKEPLMHNGVLEEAIELRNHIWTLEWILNSNDED